MSADTEAGMGDIVQRLRAQSAYMVQVSNVGADVLPLWVRAANEIERLENTLHRVIDANDIQEARRIAIGAVGTCAALKNSGGC